MKALLVIDDDEMIRCLVAAIAAKAGWAAYQAANWSEAIAAISSQKLDALLIDIVMPRFNGWQILEAIRMKPESRELPVIIMSGCDPEETRRKALAEGAICFLRKPFSCDELENALVSLFVDKVQS